MIILEMMGKRSMATRMNHLNFKLVTSEEIRTAMW